MNKRYIIPLLWLWGISYIANPLNLCQASPNYREDTQLRCRKYPPSKEEAEERSLNSFKGMIAPQKSEEGLEHASSYIGSFVNGFKKKLNFWYKELPEQTDTKGLYKKMDGEDTTPIIHSKAELQEEYDAFLAKNKIKPRARCNPTAVFESLYEDYTYRNEKIGNELFYESADECLIIKPPQEPKIDELWALFQRFPKPPVKKSTAPTIQFFSSKNKDAAVNKDDEKSKSKKGDSSSEEDESGHTAGGNDTTEEETD
jgi:hypothetical protein